MVLNRRNGNVRIFDSDATYTEPEERVFSNALRQLSDDLRRKRGGPSSVESTVEWVPFSQQRANEPDCGPICVQAIAQLSMEPECDDVKISTSARGVERLRMRQAFDLSRSTYSN